MRSELCSVEVSKAVVELTQLFKVTVSFGSVSSLISLPCYMSHASIPAELRAARGLPDDLVRISVGIEDPQDLLRGPALTYDAACMLHTRGWLADVRCRGCSWLAWRTALAAARLQAALLCRWGCLLTQLVSADLERALTMAGQQAQQ